MRIFLATFILMWFSSAAYASCATPREHVAIQARIFQNELIVAALTCDLHEEYSRFVYKFKSPMLAYSTDLKLFFNSNFDDGTYELNHFVTKTANNASLRSIKTESYCETAIERFYDILNTPQSMIHTKFYNSDRELYNCQMIAGIE